MGLSSVHYQQGPALTWATSWTNMPPKFPDCRPASKRAAWFCICGTSLSSISHLHAAQLVDTLFIAAAGTSMLE